MLEAHSSMITDDQDIGTGNQPSPNNDSIAVVLQ